MEDRRSMVILIRITSMKYMSVSKKWKKSQAKTKEVFAISLKTFKTQYTKILSLSHGGIIRNIFDITPVSGPEIQLLEFPERSVSYDS